MIIFITGMPGSGKSTVGKHVADKLGWDFYEADDALTNEMKKNISSGKLLTEAELDQWLLHNLGDVFEKYIDNDVVVSGMSGLKKHKDSLLSRFSTLKYINLMVSYEILEARLKKRKHFAGTKILEQCWEGQADVYVYGIGVDAEQKIEKVVDDCVALVKSFELQMK